MSQSQFQVYLYLDDLRPIPPKYVGVRSYTEFVKYILINGLPHLISFDQDQGEEKTGYDCAKWLISYCLDNNLQLPDYQVHSQNPVGRQNIAYLLRNFQLHQKNNK